ncbi:MAG: TIGR04190 family B12-binding domain/radical SAM domain protein [Anaerolineales bacterium]|nr:TIGR04190 family B12-binding domain/radical SAM domain protein [Anaerolineales bacterium]MCB8937074.1 TIGR04190 family B12-binding domain/radical SAM domain protein [Ardenticatenaceae bacterium]
MSTMDLLLLHPPSVYDFRKNSILYGPVSDLIPSSPVFEMYPLGFLTMTNYLESRGLRVRIVNLALRMMNDPKFDVPHFLSQLQPKVIGIDLHWLPHAHGSLEIARIAKEIHPDVPVIFGGLSSTYFHRELVAYPQVDFVLRGDSTEAPLYELLQCLAAGRSVAGVPNLTWCEDGRIHQNPLQFVPNSLDYIDLNPARIIKTVLRYRDLQSVLPFAGWWQNPITAVFTVKGCAHSCVTCGSSQEACQRLPTRTRPVFRSPRNLVQNMVAIGKFSRGPIFLVGDLFQAGQEYAYETLEFLRQTPLKNEIVFEFFGMPPLEFLLAIDAAVENWSIELSPESHDEAIRRVQDESIFYSNAEMEAVIEAALALRCHRVDLFFMIGLPQQTYQSVQETIDYCGTLFHKYDERFSCFISPLGPFIDPGSLGFEQPERFGYKLRAQTLAEHRELLLKPSWKHILNYETAWMSRHELVEATYDAAEALNGLKLKYGLIAPKDGQKVAAEIAQARQLKDRLNNEEDNHSLDADAMALLAGEIHQFSVSTVCDKRELFWRRHLFNFRLGGILPLVWEYVREELLG